MKHIRLRRKLSDSWQRSRRHDNGCTDRLCNDGDLPRPISLYGFHRPKFHGGSRDGLKMMGLSEYFLDLKLMWGIDQDRSNPVSRHSIYLVRQDVERQA
jgi:hypothetical protein